MPFLKKDNVSLYYQTFGDVDKPALIFSNSLGTNHTMWQAQIDALKDDYFIISYDTRGHGSSTTPEGNWTMADLGQDVVDLLDELNLKKANFCGISMGGLTGIWLAIYRPEYFDKIIVCNTASKIGQETAWQERANTVRHQGLQMIADSAPSRWFTDTFILNNSHIVKKLSDDLAKGDPNGYAKCCEVLAATDLRDELNKASVPMLVIAGSQDPVTTVADGEFITAGVPDSQLAIIEASHISNVEQAVAFTEQIASFINQ